MGSVDAKQTEPFVKPLSTCCHDLSKYFCDSCDCMWECGCCQFSIQTHHTPTAEPADDSSERLRSSLLTPADGRLGNPEEINDIERMCEQLDEALLVFAPAVLGCKPAASAGKKGALGVHALFKLAKNRHMSIDNIYGVLAAALGQVSSDAWEMRRERGASPRLASLLFCRAHWLACPLAF